jgi:hypothetical protein
MEGQAVIQAVIEVAKPTDNWDGNEGSVKALVLEKSGADWFLYRRGARGGSGPHIFLDRKGRQELIEALQASL